MRSPVKFNLPKTPLKWVFFLAKKMLQKFHESFVSVRSRDPPERLNWYKRSFLGLSQIFCDNSGTSRPEGQKLLKRFMIVGFAFRHFVSIDVSGPCGAKTRPSKVYGKVWSPKLWCEILCLDHLQHFFFAHRFWGCIFLRCGTLFFWPHKARGKFR